MNNFRKHENNNFVLFHEWKRKKYAVFNSLTKIIKICVLTISYSIIILPNYINAQQNDTNIIYTKEVDLDEIVVTGSRAPDIYTNIARIITIIPKNEIEQAPVQSIADLLEYALNVDVRQRGLFGVQADVNIRGGTFDQTIILINGVNISDPQTGHYSLNLPFDINAVERIEVLNGPAARIYGANAFNGAINIITTGKENTKIKSSIATGSYGYVKLSGTGAYHINNLTNFLSISRMSSDGYAENTFFDVTSVFLQSEFKKNKNHYYLQTSISSKEFGANYLPTFPTENESTKPIFLNAGFSKKGRTCFNGNVFYKQHTDHFQFLYDSAYYNYYHLNSIKGANANMLFTTPIGKSIIGVDFKNDGIVSTSLGDNLDEVIVKNKIEYSKSYSRNIFGLYYEHKIGFNNFYFSGGLMSNIFNGRKIDIYPGIDLSYNISQKMSVFTSFNKTLRNPTFTDLLYNAGDTYGNRQLKPEKAITAEIGAKYKNKIVDYKSSVFCRKADKIIDWIQLSVDSTWRLNHNINSNYDTIWYAENISNLTSLGFDGAIAINFSDLINPLFFIQSTKLYYCYLNINKDLDQYISKYALDNLKHNITLLLKNRLGKNLYFSWKFSYFDREGTFTQNNKQVKYKPVLLIDGKIIYTIQSHSIFIETSNLLNKRYYELGNQIQPGIWIRGGITMSKNFTK